MFLSKLKEKILQENFFRPRWYSVFINPYFINRNSLYNEVKKFSAKIKKTDKILDVGCGLKPYRKVFKTKEYIGIDIDFGGHPNDQKNVDHFYDGETIPYEQQTFDNILCTQVLEHTIKPETTIKEMSRVIKTNGLLFISMPFIYPEHEIPFDFQRYTKYKHIKLLTENNFSIVQIKKTTGFWGTFGQVFVVYIFESIKFRASFLKTVLSIFILGPIQIFSIILDILFIKSGPTMDYVIIARKN